MEPFHRIVKRDEAVIDALSNTVVGFMNYVRMASKAITKRPPPSDFVTVWSDGLDWSE